MPTEVIKVIDTAGGGDYTSIKAAIDGEARNLVAADQIAIFEFTGGRDYAGDLYIRSPWVTDQSHYIHFRPHTESQRATSKFSTSKYYLERRDFYYGFQIERNNVIWEGMQMIGIDMFFNFYFNAASQTNGFWKIIGCFINGGTPHHMYQIGSGNKVYLINNIIISTKFSSYSLSYSSAEIYAYNNTYKNNNELYLGTSVRFKNNIVSAGSLGIGGTPHADSDFNVSNIAGDPVGANGIIGAPVFKNVAQKDFSLLATDTIAKGNGLDLSTDLAYPFADDIDLQERLEPWSIGAYQFNILPEEEGSVRSRLRRWRKYWRGWRRFGG